MPDQARAVARELGVCYYETSVFTYYGVNEVFENSIRAALIARRQQRFWMTNLKRVQRPLLQVINTRDIDFTVNLILRKRGYGRESRDSFSSDSRRRTRNRRMYFESLKERQMNYKSIKVTELLGCIRKHRDDFAFR